MSAALSLSVTVPPPRAVRWMPLGLSVLLHALVALLWLGFPASENPAPGDKVVQVELVAEPPRPSPPMPPAAALQSQAGPPAAAAPGLPVPQLEDGMLAQRSSAPKAKESPAAPPQPRVEPAPKPRKPEPVTQSERDLVLSQVLRHWTPPPELSAYDRANLQVAVVVDAQGYFDDLYDARRPWAPAAIFDGYAGLPPDSLQRRTIDSFYRAIRQAQPLRLPAALKAKAPFRVRLDFRVRDVR